MSVCLSVMSVCPSGRLPVCLDTKMHVCMIVSEVTDKQTGRQGGRQTDRQTHKIQHSAGTPRSPSTLEIGFLRVLNFLKLLGGVNDQFCFFVWLLLMVSG